MKWFLRAFFVLVIANIIAGYVIRQKDMALGENWIGLSVATGYFVYMPSFVAIRVDRPFLCRALRSGAELVEVLVRDVIFF